MLEFLNQNAPLKFIVAFAIVLGLIALAAWLVRRFGANRLGSSARGRQPRLAVVDAASVDGRRRLVLIRRDNVEHLVMIGGPTDVLIEPNIVRAVRTDTRAGAENGNGAWPLQPAVEPPPVAPVQQRGYRAPSAEETWTPPEPPAREPAMRPRPSDDLAGLASEFNAKLSPALDSPAPPRMAPVNPPAREPAVVPPPVAPGAPQSDRNLAEMAQRLEAALRRPGAAEPHPPVTDPLAAPVASPKPAETKIEPRVEFRPEPKPEPRVEPKAEARVEPKPAKNPFESLEEEMASLLGRSGKT
jgi:hypothetical protein